MAITFNKKKPPAQLSLLDSDSAGYLPPTAFTKEALKASYQAYEGLTDAQISALLVERLMATEKEMPIPPTVLSEPNRKWRAISAYQKCIRRAELGVSHRAGAAVFRSDASYFMRRMSIVMFEDVGLANLPLCALSIALQGQMKMVRGNGDLLIPLYMTQVAALNPTDRTLCEVAVTAKRADVYAETRADYFSMVEHEHLPDDLLEVFKIESDPIHQYLAALALVGGLKKGEVASRKHIPIFIEILQEMNVPALLSYCVRSSLRLGMEGLPIALPVNWNEFTDAKLVVRELPSTIIVGGLPSVAYDKHVLEGKRSIAYFNKACKPVAEFLSVRPNLKKVDAVGSAIFEEEGGNVLQTSLSYPFQLKQLKTARTAHLFSSGLGKDEGEELCGLVRDNLDSLNAARKRVIDGKGSE